MNGTRQPCGAGGSAEPGVAGHPARDNERPRADFFGGSAVEYRRIVNAWFENELEKDLDLRRRGA